MRALFSDKLAAMLGPSPAIFAAALLVSACGPHEAPGTPSSATPPATAHAAPPPDAPPTAAAPTVPVAPPSAASATQPGAQPSTDATTPAPAVPAKPLTKTSTWPFVAWDRAEAITFNHLPYGPGVQLRVYDDVRGWSPKIAGRRPITRPQGERAVKWVIATGGAVEVSKCAFPRHAVVLYAGDTPVGTANVCFECGDILVWPDLDPPPDYDHWTDAAEKRYERSYKRKLAAYEKVFPQWEQFFRDELGFPLVPVPRP